MKKPKNRRIAAIDVGTNSFHLIVAEASPTTGRFRILDREKEHVRLGSGSSDMKVLSDAAMDRAISTLTRFSDIASSFSASIRAIATSAVREALNSEEFIRKVEKKTGIRLEVASGPEEGRLIHLGVLQVLPLYHKKILLVDIGGGSTEFLIGRRRKIHYVNSLKIGSVRLTRRFFPDGTVTPRSVDLCRSFIRGSIEPVARETRKMRIDEAVGTSGTVIALARVIQQTAPSKEGRMMNGFRITRREFERVVDLALSLRTAADRATLPGIERQRAEIFPAGLLILERAFSEFDLASIVVSEFALREGIVRDTIEKSRARNRVPVLTDIQRASVEHTLEQFQTEKKHSEHVASLALGIFDQTTELHKLGPTERNYLEVASLLHEVGLHISHSQHHRHSYYLIRYSDIVGYTEREKEIIANVARYHRKSHPKEKHAEYRKLTAPDRETVRKLASILRIADGLDRRHTSSVRKVRVAHQGEAVSLDIHAGRTSNLEIELWGANLKKDLFEEVFGVRVELAATARGKK